MKRSASALIIALLTLQIGCGYVQKPSWNKPVGKGTWIPAVVCALVGGGVGVAIQDATNKCNTVRGEDIQCDDDLWQGGVIGAAVGAVACGLAGHVFLDPTPTFPPLPPTPEPTPLPTPEPTPEIQVPITRRIVLRGINFDFNSSEIRAHSAPVLDEAVKQLASNPDVDVLVVGHTDSVGSEDYNQKLSLLRAEAVYRYLVNRGIAPERLTATGMGESSPVATNDTEQGRARNRRVELKVSD
jgi:OOP family OmpA-OmpF porin